MPKTDDGGAAFPNSVQPDFQYAEAGMSLRDWFAGQALVGIVAALGGLPSLGSQFARNPDAPHIYADTAYRMADAMLAAREGGAS